MTDAVTETVSLVVCTHRRPHALGRLLDALELQDEPPEEVLVVDGSSDDATEVAIAARRPPRFPLRYLRVPPAERGLTKQRNFGIERATRPLVAFLDDDTVPEPGYLAALRAAFRRHPDAVGTGGYITGVEWRRRERSGRVPLAVYRHDGWERRDDLRYRLRRLLGLDSPLPPGRLPPSGHARSLGFLPPDGADRPVDFLMGGASCWRRTLFERVRFSPAYEGYGLYEDLDFSIRAARHGGLYLVTSARLAHLHEPAARPDPRRYGRMVVRNGWRVWRTAFPAPPVAARLRWWAVTLLLAVVRLVDGVRAPRQALPEAVGRFQGMLAVLRRPPWPEGAREP